MQYFSDWVKNNIEEFCLFKQELNEARKEFNASVKQCDANPGSFKELEKILGKIPTESEAFELYSQGKWTGFFIKNNGDIKFVGKDGKTNQDKEFGKIAANTIASLKGKNVEMTEGGDLVITLSTGQKCKIIHTGQGPKVSVSKSGETVTAKYITNETEIQEAITAAILNIKAHKIKVNGSLDEKLVNFINNSKKISKFTDFEKWVYSSSPLNNQGLCQFIDFGVPNDPTEIYEFQKELYSFLDGAWIKSFAAMYNSSTLMKDLAKIFNPAMSEAQVGKSLFLHFKNIIDGEKLGNTIIGPYLRDARAGFDNKDVLDKTDILWCLDGNLNRCLRSVEKLMEAPNGQVYCDMVNELVAKNTLIGISLKQIGKELHLAAVNFKTFTTANTPNINKDMMVLVKYFGPNNKENTFDWESAKIYQKAAKGVVIRVPILNNHDIHADVKYVEIRCGSFSSKVGNIAAEWGIPGFPAKMGKFTKVLNDVLNFRLVDIRDKYFKKGLSWPEIYAKVGEELVKVIRQNPKELSKIFALGVGYPVQFNKKQPPELDSAPYIKIY